MWSVLATTSHPQYVYLAGFKEEEPFCFLLTSLIGPSYRARYTHVFHYYHYFLFLHFRFLYEDITSNVRLMYMLISALSQCLYAYILVANELLIIQVMLLLALYLITELF